MAAMLETREPSSAAWIQPMSSAPDCSCCIIAASLPSWPEWKTVTLRRPSVSFFSASPNCTAARFHEWPAGVIRPRRNSLVSAARTRAGKPSPVTVAAATVRGGGLLEQTERQAREQRQHHPRHAGDNEKRQPDDEHLSGLGTGERRRDK